MKKIILLFVLMIISASSYAQIKGDIYIGGSFVAENFFDKTEVNKYRVSVFDTYAEVGYFIDDNFRLSMSLGLPFSSTAHKFENTDRNSKESSSSFIINPNAAYYIKLTDKIYYTPEFGVGINIGITDDKISADDSRLYNINAYISFLSFEMKVTNNFSVALNSGHLTYGVYSFINKLDTNYLDFNFLASNQVALRWYF